ncbi:hypothetical protein FDECE_1132 [Fusarium decemcellulare]|nr:hypothetical protein FDECE_1132 [Fusarium decemcellulare]
MLYRSRWSASKLRNNPLFRWRGRAASPQRDEASTSTSAPTGTPAPSGTPTSTDAPRPTDTAAPVRSESLVQYKPTPECLAGLKKAGAELDAYATKKGRTFTLEPAQPGAQCSAGDHCIVRQFDFERFPQHQTVTSSQSLLKIEGRYQIRTRKSGTDRFFHVICFKRMMDLPSLVPDRFEMSPAPGEGDWFGNGVQKWFLCRGRVDFNRIAAHFRAGTHRENRDRWTRVPKLEISNRHYCNDPNTCICISPSQIPHLPVLPEDVTDPGGQMCNLTQLTEWQPTQIFAGGVL